MFGKGYGGGECMNEAEVMKARKGKKNVLIKPKKKKHPVLNALVTVSGAAFIMYCLSSIVITQAEISEKKQELAVLTEKAEKLEDENDEYRSILSEEDEREFMERYAIEVLGYAYPNERRFYDTTGN